MSPDLSIIIVTYNSEKHIGGLLDSIKKSPDKLKKEVIVIDNASSDQSVSVILKHSLKPTLIQSKTNNGFSHAVNLGLKKATGKYIFLLNPDTRIVGNALKRLVAFARQCSPLGAVAPRLLNSNNTPQASAFHFPCIANAIRAFFLNQQKYFNKYLPLENTQLDVAVMAAFLIPQSVIQKIGYLDERFFLYYEDIEYCRRLKKANLPIYYLKEAKIRHAHGASGNFNSHLDSPLANSAQIYHGKMYSQVLNIILWLGQKYRQSILKK